MNTQFKKGILELCILSLIKQDDLYGYQLVSELEEYIEVSINSVYPILRRLTSDGLLTTYETNEGARKRKYYTLTKEGHEHFDRYLSEYIEFTKSVDKLLVKEQDYE